MKNKLMLAAALAIAVNANSQTILGTHSNDSTLLRANYNSLSMNNIKLRSQGQVAFFDVPVNYGDLTYGPSTASVVMKKRGPDNTALLITDNPSQGIKSAQIGIINSNSSTCENGMYVSNENKWVSNRYISLNYSIASVGGGGGYYRLNNSTTNNGARTYYGYRSNNTTESSASGVNFVSFSSGGSISYTCDDMTDFHVEDLNNTGTCVNRYGLKIDFDNSGVTYTNPWGVYQTYGDIKNHFNGATLFGTTTDNTFDKVQVTGGTQTDGFAAAIRTETGNYPAINTDYTILVNAASATITLPTSGIPNGKIYCIKNINSTPGVVTIETDAPSTNKIDGSNSKTLNLQYESMMVQFNGTHYFVLATH